MKPISNGSPANGMGSGSLASPTSGVWAEIATSPSLKLSRSGAFFCAMRLMRRTTSSELLARRGELVLVGLGQQLAVVRELTVDQAARERDAADLEDDLVGAHADADLLDVVADEPAELLERAGGDVGLEAAVERRLELRLLHAQAVGVGRDHPQLVARRPRRGCR